MKYMKSLLSSVLHALIMLFLINNSCKAQKSMKSLKTRHKCC